MQPPFSILPASLVAVALSLAGGTAHAQVVLSAPPEPAPVVPPSPEPGVLPDNSLFAPLPPVPTVETLPPLDLGLAIEMPEPPPADPGLMEPLPPLGAFDPAPSADFKFTQAADSGVRYQVRIEGLAETGLEGSFRRLSALVRGQNRPATAAQIASRANSDETLMGRLFNSEGWFGGTSETGFDLPEAGGRAEIRIIATPGVRYNWRKITLDLIPEDRADLAEGFDLRVGTAVRAIEVEEAEGALLRRLTEAGHPFAEIGARDVVLDSGALTATYLLTGQIGPLGVFGPIRLTGYQPFDEGHAAVIARFETGEPYDSRLVDDFRRALIATQQFAGVTVSAVDTGLREPDGRAVTEIRVTGNEGPKRLLSGQVGFATEEGFRAEAAWRHRNLLPPEGNAILRGVLGTEEQRASATVTKSNFRQRDRTLEVGVEIANLTPPAYNATSFTVGTEIGRASTPIWQKRWTWSVGFGLGYSRERSRALPEPRDDDGGGDPDDPPGFDARREFLFATLPVRVGYDRSDDLLDPTRGFRVNGEINPEISREGQRVETYARLFLEGTGYQPLGDLVLAGRLRLGSIVGASLVDIAPTRRLYAGGGGSVRGFDFQGVGPIGFNDRPIGGRGLIEGSIEARYRFGDFGVVGFVDAGAVSEDSLPQVTDPRFGVGIGGRYYTNFGPIRIDVARAVNRRDRDPPIALYISIGQAF